MGLTPEEGRRRLAETRAMWEASRNRAEQELGVRRGEDVVAQVTRLEGHGAAVVTRNARGEKIEGFIHVSELAWEHVNHPSEVLRVGERVEVRVLDVNPRTRQVSFGVKQLTPNPWEVFAAAHPVGSECDAIIVRTAAFGAFLNLGGRVEALWRLDVNAPRPAWWHQGQQVRVRLSEVDPERRRIHVSGGYPLAPS